ncbi:MAG: hypothetical protein R6T87_03420, partial [Marinobacter sp.]
ESRRHDLFDGVNLNLNFPSVVGTISVGNRQVEYGYMKETGTLITSAIVLSCFFRDFNKRKPPGLVSAGG